MTIAQIGLDSKTLELIRSVFEQFSQIHSVVLFGSRAKGNHKVGSDIDLCIQGDPIPFSLLTEIDSALNDLNLPYKIDLVLADQIINMDLLDHIARRGLTVYSASKNP